MKTSGPSMAGLEKLSQGVATASSNEMQALAAEVAQAIPENYTLALHGDLGVGKTTFVQGLARAWNIAEPVTSPTFNLLSIYQGTRFLLHLDAYRLNHPDEIDSLMLEDFLAPPYCLAVEWPERLGKRLPTPCWHIELKIRGVFHDVSLL